MFFSVLLAKVTFFVSYNLQKVHSDRTPLFPSIVKFSPKYSLRNTRLVKVRSLRETLVELTRMIWP